tara:strand:- start:36687 stop:36908 length:222 start_codon:yes stop_codon:yes gene_type:complete
MDQRDILAQTLRLAARDLETTAYGLLNPELPGFTDEGHRALRKRDIITVCYHLSQMGDKTRQMAEDIEEKNDV